MSHHKDKDHKHPHDEPGKNPSAQSPADDGANAPVSQEQYDALKTERDDLMGRLQRLSADYVNYQKRSARDLSQAREFANEDLIKALLPALDDMSRALEHARANHDAQDPLLVGMELVQKKALETLGRFGLTIISAAGEPFDPERHAALMQEPSAKCPPRTVLRELQCGYQLKGRTLRPAQVVISKEPETEHPQE